MEFNNLALLKMLSLLYEDLDLDTIEERFVSLIGEVFAFDRVGLFFVKHKRGILRGKLCKGFDQGTISSLKIPITENNLFTRPLVSGFPCRSEEAHDDEFAQRLGLTEFAVIPVVNKKRISCWLIKDCQEKKCPAYGNQWVRCWLVKDTKCAGHANLGPAEKQDYCETCPVHVGQDTEAVEGILLVDNSLSGRKIDDEAITILAIIAHAVGNAINNSKAYSSIMRVAIRDELTGIHNRRYFNERLLDEIDRSKRYGTLVCLVMADIDHFKKINDLHGHPVGDSVLIWIAAQLSSKLRSSDVIARYGGEEFALLLINTSKEQAGKVAEILRATIADAVMPEELPINVTISFGVAALNIDASSFEGLLARADKALYRAKAQGRNKVCLA